MSYITDGQKGLEAVEGKKWEEGIELLSRAVGHSKNPAWLLARSHAYQETKKLVLALQDADHAYVSASERQNPKSREQMALAQYRRAVILGHLKRYADADACCVWSQQLLEGKHFRRDADDVAQNVDADGDYLATATEALSTSTMPVEKDAAAGGPASNKAGSMEWTRAYVWRSMMLNAMGKLPKGDPGRKITVSRVPMKPADAQKAESADEDQAETEAAMAAVNEEAAKWATKKLRVDFYQQPDKVNLVLYAKGADKDKVQVDVRESEVGDDHFNLLKHPSFSALLDMLLITLCSRFTSPTCRKQRSEAHGRSSTSPARWTRRTRRSGSRRSRLSSR